MANALPSRYEIDHQKVKLIVIAQHKYAAGTNYSVRVGNDLDMDALLKLKSHYGWTYFEFMHYSKEDLLRVIQSTVKNDLQDADAVFCVIMTHGGNEGCLIAHDQPYHLNDILSLFGDKAAPHLKKKPKIFFVQACRGRQLDGGCLDFVHQDHPNPIPFHFRGVDVGPHFLVAWATMEGYQSFRRMQFGSWFIQELVKALILGGDLSGIVAQVIKAVTEKYFTIGFSEDKQYKEVPCVTDKLPKILFL